MNFEEFDELTRETSFSPAAKIAIKEASGDWVNTLGRWFNWDYDPELFLPEVYKHPECNLVTACTIFFLGSPSDDEGNLLSELDEWQRPTVEMLVDLHTRINNGQFLPEPSKWPCDEDSLYILRYGLENFCADSAKEAADLTGIDRIAWGLNPDIVNHETLGISN
ncbi:MAG: hypothetical protein QNJ29_11940 [Rhizobiaceae bacterium]|nr:hypothetical protein [Rhizobiaceae bacterium]